jgi:hypothetical protein
MRFAKAQEKKMGQPQGEVIKKREPQKSPISKIWISTLPSGGIRAYWREYEKMVWLTDWF